MIGKYITEIKHLNINESIDEQHVLSNNIRDTKLVLDKESIYADYNQGNSLVCGIDEADFLKRQQKERSGPRKIESRISTRKSSLYRTIVQYEKSINI